MPRYCEALLGHTAFVPRTTCSVGAIAVGIGLTELVGAVAGSAIVGAVLGAGVSAITGGNVLQGALLGGAGGGISGWLSGAGSAAGAAGGGVSETLAAAGGGPSLSLEQALANGAITLQGDIITAGIGSGDLLGSTILSLGANSGLGGVTAVSLSNGGTLDLPTSFIDAGAAVFGPDGNFLGISMNSPEGKLISGGYNFNPATGDFWTGSGWVNGNELMNQVVQPAMQWDVEAQAFLPIDGVSGTTGLGYSLPPAPTTAPTVGQINQNTLAGANELLGQSGSDALLGNVQGGTGGPAGASATTVGGGAAPNANPLNLSGASGGTLSGNVVPGAGGVTGGGSTIGAGNALSSAVQSGANQILGGTGSNATPGEGFPDGVFGGNANQPQGAGIPTGDSLGAGAAAGGGILSGILGGGAGGLGALPTLAAAGGNVISALLGSNAAQNAAELQANAANAAAGNQMQMFNAVRSDLAPYNALGLAAAPKLAELTGTNAGGNPLTAALTKPFTGADLENTPGYQFTRDQGLKAVVNANSARGLAGGGGALSTDMAKYATGLASTTYNDQLKNYLAQNQQIFNMLSGIVQGGQNAATQTGSFGVQSQTAANNLLTSGANAQAAGVVGSANAYGNATNNIGNLLLTNALLQSMYGGGNAAMGG